MEVEQPPAAVVSEQEPEPTVVPEIREMPELIRAARTGSRRQILLQAIDELPDRLQRIARLRVTSTRPIGEIARDTELQASEVEQILLQAQAIIARTLGPEYVIEHISEDSERQRIVIHADAEPLSPARDSESQAAPDLAGTEDRPDLAEAIRAPLEALTAPLLGAPSADAEIADAQHTIREALRDATPLVRPAA